MNEGEGYKIYCSRCGAEMSSNSRYCMKCGNLNYDHEANKNMRPYIQAQNNTTYEVGAGKYVVQSNNSGDVHTSLATNTGNKKTCFIVNYLFYWIGLFVLFAISSAFTFDINVVLEGLFPLYVISFSIFMLYIYSLELMFMKCNKPWWAIFVPIYSLMEMGDIAFRNKWIGLLTMIPGVGIILSLVITYNIGKMFGYNGILTILFPFIYFPLIGYGSNTYEGHLFITGDKKDIEKEYKRKKVFLFTMVIGAVLGIGAYAYTNLNKVESGVSNLSNYYYVNAANRLVSKLQDELGKNEPVVCKYGAYTNESGIYYFEYPDVGDILYLPGYASREVIQGYVKVDNTSGVSQYYVSLTDGSLGFPETEVSLINNDSVRNYSKLMEYKNESTNICKIQNLNISQ